MECNYLDSNKAVFDKYSYIDIDRPLNNQDRDIYNSVDRCLQFVGMWINNDKVNWHRNLTYLNSDHQSTKIKRQEEFTGIARLTRETIWTSTIVGGIRCLNTSTIVTTRVL